MLGRSFPQWVLEQYPWTKDLLEWLDWFRQALHAYEGVILLVGLVVVWRGLRHESKKLGDRIDTLRQLVSAVRDQSEIAQPVALSSTAVAPSASVGDTNAESGRGRFEVIRELWRSARERIELAIEEIPRSRVRSKYGQLQRYSYREVILALHKDEIVSSKEMTELLRMNGIFDSLRSRPSTATGQQVENFKEAYTIGTKSLPKPPDVDGEPPPVSAQSPQELDPEMTQPQRAAS